MSATSPAPVSPDDAAPWPGPWVRYDLVKEFVIALVVVTGLAVLLTILFSSPDDSATTIQSWAKASPADFLTTAVTELNGTSEVATYGPPYTHTSGVSQEMAGISPAEVVGVHIPIDTAKDYVIDPLKEIPADPRLKAALAAY